MHFVYMYEIANEENLVTRIKTGSVFFTMSRSHVKKQETTGKMAHPKLEGHT